MFYVDFKYGLHASSPMMGKRSSDSFKWLNYFTYIDLVFHIMNTVTSYATQGPLCDLRGEEKDKEGKKRATLLRVCVCPYPYMEGWGWRMAGEERKKERRGKSKREQRGVQICSAHLHKACPAVYPSQPGKTYQIFIDSNSLLASACVCVSSVFMLTVVAKVTTRVALCYAFLPSHSPFLQVWCLFEEECLFP